MPQATTETAAALRLQGYELGLQCPEDSFEQAVRRATFVLHLGPTDEVVLVAGHERPRDGRSAGWDSEWIHDPAGYTVYVRRLGPPVYRDSSRKITGLPALVLRP